VEAIVDDLERTLCDHPFLAGLDARHVATLARCASVSRHAAGEYLLREGERATGSFLLVAGRVALEIHRPGGNVIVATVPRGGVVGWSWLLTPHRWHFDARAVEETRAIALDGGRLREACEQDHDLGWELARRYLALAHERIEALRLQLFDVYGAAAP
jgi:CRP-like cAMP-binding protein